MYAYLKASNPLKWGSLLNGDNKGSTTLSRLSKQPNLKAGNMPSSSNFGMIGSKILSTLKYGLTNDVSCIDLPWYVFSPVHVLDLEKSKATTIYIDSTPAFLIANSSSSKFLYLSGNHSYSL